MSDDNTKAALRAEVDEIDARLQQIAASDHELERLRDDPEVRRRLDDYAKQYGEGDPTWWKPEFEVSDAIASERIEHVVASVPKAFIALSDTIAKVVINNSSEQLERLSGETGIAVADLRALEASGDALGRSHVALRIARQVHAIGNAVSKYGLERAEFEQLEQGPADRGAGTIVGRKQRPAPKAYRVAPEGITGTAKLDVPDEVNASRVARGRGPEDAATLEPTAASGGDRAGGARDRRRVLGVVVGAVALGAAILVVRGTSCGRAPEAPRSAVTPSATSMPATESQPTAPQAATTPSSSSANVASSAPAPSTPEPTVSPSGSAAPPMPKSAQPQKPPAPGPPPSPSQRPPIPFD